jgi:hypothetical protein
MIVDTRVARWFVFKPKIPIWVNFWGPSNEKCLYILWSVGIFYGHLVKFMAVCYSLWSLCIFFPFWYVWTNKNLATLVDAAKVFSQNESPRIPKWRLLKAGGLRPRSSVARDHRGGRPANAEVRGKHSITWYQKIHVFVSIHTFMYFCWNDPLPSPEDRARALVYGVFWSYFRSLTTWRVREKVAQSEAHHMFCQN